MVSIYFTGAMPTTYLVEIGGRTSKMNNFQAKNIVKHFDRPFTILDSQTRNLSLIELQPIWERTKKTIFGTHNISESVMIGNKVEIFKHMMSKIKKEIIIDYRRSRLAEDQSPQKYYREILEELKSEVIARAKDGTK